MAWERPRPAFPASPEKTTFSCPLKEVREWEGRYLRRVFQAEEAASAKEPSGESGERKGARQRGVRGGSCVGFWSGPVKGCFGGCSKDLGFYSK